MSPPNKTLIVWILGSLATITPFAIDLYLPAFGQIAEEFKTSQADVSLTVSGYFIGLAIGQILYGPLLDRFGRTAPLYAGLVIFITASVACTQAETIYPMVVFRFIQALSGSVAWVAAVTMIRDFFPVEESAKVFSLLVLIIGVSPLFAPTVGGFIVTGFGWKAVFFILAGIVVLIIAFVFFFLPPPTPPDPTVSLKARPMINTFLSILRDRQFFTYTLSGSFSFATLFIYVAGSPVIFMEIFDLSPRAFGGMFALVTGAFIAGSQINVLLVKKFSSASIFRVALLCQVAASLVLLVGSWIFPGQLQFTAALLLICLMSLGFSNPNANALSLAPFSRNVGSASALMGFTQIGIAALASSAVGMLKTATVLPIAGLIAGTALAALGILWFSNR